MDLTKHEETLRVYKLDEEKILKMIDRAVKACMAYESGEMTLKQVWYRARGDRFQMACQLHPDRELGGRLWELGMDFYTQLGAMEYVIIDSIFRVLDVVRENAGPVH